jgi:hypothetical protein
VILTQRPRRRILIISDWVRLLNQPCGAADISYWIVGQGIVGTSIIAPSIWIIGQGVVGTSIIEQAID